MAAEYEVNYEHRVRKIGNPLSTSVWDSAYAAISAMWNYDLEEARKESKIPEEELAIQWLSAVSLADEPMAGVYVFLKYRYGDEPDFEKAFFDTSGEVCGLSTSDAKFYEEHVEKLREKILRRVVEDFFLDGYDPLDDYNPTKKDKDSKLDKTDR